MSNMKKLGFGLMRLPLNSEYWEDVDYEKSKELIDEYMSKGFNYFDTAAHYHMGNSQLVVKAFLANRYSREQFILANKLPIFDMNDKTDPEECRIRFNRQLEDCGVEYFDYYMVPSLGRRNYYLDKKLGFFRFVSEMKAAGRVKRMGFSYHDDSILLEQILKEHPNVDFVQLQINYLDWNDECVQARKNYEVCRRYGVDIIVMGPLRGGALAGIRSNEMLQLHPDWSPASWAMRFAASLPNVIMVLSGMNHMEQLIDNTEILGNFDKLTEQETEILMNAADALSGIAGKCTGCNYCLSKCPKHIQIPRFINYYEKNVYFDYINTPDTYLNLISEGRPSEMCLNCGKCVEICPQGIDIPDILRKSDEMLDFMG